jgi:hypothetical protein
MASGIPALTLSDFDFPGNRLWHKAVIACRIGSLQGCQNVPNGAGGEGDTRWFGAP